MHPTCPQKVNLFSFGSTYQKVWGSIEALTPNGALAWEKEQLKRSPKLSPNSLAVAYLRTLGGLVLVNTVVELDNLG